MLLHIMSQYLCLFSLILQGLHKEGDAGSWDSGLEKEQILETYSAQLQKSWNFMEAISRIYKKYWVQEVPERGHTLAMRVGRAQGVGRAPTLVARVCPPLELLALSIFYIFSK